MYKIKKWVSDMNIYRKIGGILVILMAILMLLRVVFIYHPLVGYGLTIFTLVYLGCELLNVFKYEYDWQTRVFIWASGYLVVPFLTLIYHLGKANNNNLALFYWLLIVILIIWFICLICLIGDRENYIKNYNNNKK